MFQARQGDVLIQQVARIPRKVKPVERDVGRVVLAYGEVTGHAHAIVDRNATLLTTEENERFLRIVGSGATVVHEEHAPVVLPPGEFQVVIQTEYSPEALRQVTD